MNAKKKQLRQADYLQHMLDAIRLARSYVEGISREEFLADKKTQQAVVRRVVRKQPHRLNQRLCNDKAIRRN